MTDCIFCKIAQHESTAFTLWENENFIAFLSIFPNTEGVTVVSPKNHYFSDIFNNEDNLIFELIAACKVVQKKIKMAFPDVGRVGMVFEGFGVDHLHAKLFPLHGTGHLKQWQPIKSDKRDLYTLYPGYISSHDGPREEDAKLTFLMNLIKSKISS